MDKREQRYQQNEGRKHLKKTASEVKCSWRQSAPGVMMCHQKLVHQKL